MKIRSLLSFAILSVSSFAVLGADISPLTRQLIDRSLRSSADMARIHRAPADDEAEEAEGEEYAITHYPLILMAESAEIIPALIPALEEYNVRVWNTRNDLLLVSVPLEHISEVLAIEGIVYASASGDMSACMDMARPAGNVDVVQRGEQGLGTLYDGRGVVVGFCDIGFDPNHIAFAGRVAQVHNFDAYTAAYSSAVTPDEIAAWTTDEPTQTHATHVANIMAGGYREGAYYGVAPGATIVGTTSRLSDVGILAGAEKIIEYAKARNMPAVINMSLSNYTGPHDGTDLFCRYLSSLAEDAALCISSGNNGGTNTFATFEGDASEHYLRILDKPTWTGLNMRGYTDIWSDNDRPFRVHIFIYDAERGRIIYQMPWVGGEDDEPSQLVDAENFPAWANYFDGYLRIDSELSPLNNRYNITVSYDYSCATTVAGQAWTRYMVLVSAKADPGTRIDMYADGSQTFFQRQGSNLQPTANGSINDMCTAPGVISVGAWNTRNSAPRYDSETPFSWSFSLDCPAQFSSYAATPGIEPLPHFCAPGNYTVSALSTPCYLAEHPGVSAMEPEGYYWYPQCGTSMASPYAAGVMALWLQADPDLSPAQLRDIAVKTARTDLADTSNPRWGAGAIDALAGIRHITSETNLVTGTSRPRQVGWYTLTGMRIDLSDAGRLPAGIYIEVLSDGSTAKRAIRR